MYVQAQKTYNKNNEGSNRQKVVFLSIFVIHNYYVSITKATANDLVHFFTHNPFIDFRKLLRTFKSKKTNKAIPVVDMAS
jgi:hypothetical protein